MTGNKQPLPEIEPARHRSAVAGLVFPLLAILPSAWFPSEVGLGIHALSAAALLIALGFVWASTAQGGRWSWALVGGSVFGGMIAMVAALVLPNLSEFLFVGIFKSPSSTRSGILLLLAFVSATCLGAPALLAVATVAAAASKTPCPDLPAK